MTQPKPHTIVLERGDGERIDGCTTCPWSRPHVHAAELERGNYTAGTGDVLVLGGAHGVLRLALGERTDVP